MEILESFVVPEDIPLIWSLAISQTRHRDIVGALQRVYNILLNKDTGLLAIS